MGRNRALVRRPGKTIDFKSWDAIPGLFFTGPASTGNTGGAGLFFTEPAPILRMRGRFHVSLNETAQLGDRATIGVAIGVVSSDAATLGSTALPDPIGDPEYPWLYWQEVDLTAFETATSNARSWGTASQLIEFDVKSMRKMKPSMTLALVLETANFTGDPVIDFLMTQTRVLIGT